MNMSRIQHLLKCQRVWLARARDNIDCGKLEYVSQDINKAKDLNWSLQFELVVNTKTSALTNHPNNQTTEP